MVDAMGRLEVESDATARAVKAATKEKEERLVEADVWKLEMRQLRGLLTRSAALLQSRLRWCCAPKHATCWGSWCGFVALRCERLCSGQPARLIILRRPTLVPTTHSALQQVERGAGPGAPQALPGAGAGGAEERGWDADGADAGGGTAAAGGPVAGHQGAQVGPA